MSPKKEVVEMSFSEVEALSLGDWITKIKEWMQKVEETLEGYEVSSATLTVSVPPSASVTVTKKCDE